MKRTGKYLFTSESVGEGHPDKVSDQISDSVLDAIFTHDPKARVDCETLVMQGTVMITGQITTCTYINIPKIVRQTLKEIGFDNAKDGLDWETCGILVSLLRSLQTLLWALTNLNVMSKVLVTKEWFSATHQTRQKSLCHCQLCCAHKLVKRLAECRKTKHHALSAS